MYCNIESKVWVHCSTTLKKNKSVLRNGVENEANAAISSLQFVSSQRKRTDPLLLLLLLLHFLFYQGRSGSKLTLNERGEERGCERGGGGGGKNEEKVRKKRETFLSSPFSPPFPAVPFSFFCFILLLHPRW